ncbi:hypothetical protein GQ607_017048 [Colletotrichum asianum]|uniref:Uncharacterized protein n=1 Tax=Colletotrichum asianum TaxID=702518 RepID=A0A8H3VY93_9PEZI|nr:hypothetical protein GQ607_017048 [Colletotrichum asianum]
MGPSGHSASCLHSAVHRTSYRAGESRTAVGSITLDGKNRNRAELSEAKSIDLNQATGTSRPRRSHGQPCHP